MTVDATQPAMSESELKAFLEQVKGDTSLQDKLKAAADADAVVAIAKATGFVISAEEFRAESFREVSEDELEAAAGGLNPIDVGASINYPLICHILDPRNEG